MSPKGSLKQRNHQPNEKQYHRHTAKAVAIRQIKRDDNQCNRFDKWHDNPFRQPETLLAATA